MEEHDLRVRRARQIMEEDNLDVLLLGRNVNVFYATGSRFVFVGKEEPVALAPQSVAIITKDADIYSQRFGPFDSDAVALHTTTSANIELYTDELEIVNILRDYGVGPGMRIGTEWGAGPLCRRQPAEVPEAGRTSPDRAQSGGRGRYHEHLEVDGDQVATRGRADAGGGAGSVASDGADLRPHRGRDE